MKRLLSSFIQLPVSTEIDKNELIHEYVKNHQLFFVELLDNLQSVLDKGTLLFLNILGFWSLNSNPST